MQAQTANLRHLILIQTAVGASLSLLTGLGWDLQLGASTAIGSTLIALSALAHGWTWQLLLGKKAIAWSALIIVIKYAVLLGSLYLLSKTTWFKMLGAGLGIASITLTSLIYVFFERKKELKDLGRSPL